MTMNNPNDRQVGDSNYKSSYNLWDFVLVLNLGYLDGIVVKYVTRWRKSKNPPQDLAKARHYIDKMIATAAVCYPRLRLPRRFCLDELHDFVEANDLSPTEAAALVGMVTWETKSDLVQVQATIDELLLQYDVS